MATNSSATSKKKTKSLAALTTKRVIGKNGPIEHVFVLMLENRSFDHLFGLSGLFGTLPPPPSFGFKPGAKDVLTTDPPHEFDDLENQIAGGTMSGFPKSGGPSAMLGFEAGSATCTGA